jgi:tetratricopeptide (TPR) repeat protein
MAGAYPNLGRADQAVVYGEQAREIAAEIGDSTIAILANTYLGAAHYFLGDYQGCVDCTRRVIALLPRERSHESFGVAIRPAVFARGFLCWALSDLGRFDEGEAMARETLEIAEAVGHPQTVVAGLLSIGTLHVRRGDVALAIAPFERARELCLRHDVPLWRPVFAAFLGYSLALTARFAEAESLLREALEQSALMRMGSFHSQMIMWLSEARLLMGAAGDAGKLADDALESTREKHEAGLEGWALHLAAEVLTHREPLDLARAEDLYRQAMRQAERLGGRPLTARCHLGLGSLYRRAGRDREARDNLERAAALFRDMGMRLWSDRVDAETRRMP